jgi:hypothetical protein
MLLYDGDSRGWSATAAWLAPRLRTPVLVVPWQEVPDLGELGLTPAEARARVLWVDIYGRTRRGHRAVARLLRLGRGAWPVAGVALDLPPLGWLGGAVCRLLALR